MALKNLWICPKCGRRFANRNQSHSCGHCTIKQHLKGKSPHVTALYKRFLELVRQCGSVILAPTKTRIGFQVRMIFAAVSLKQGGLACHVVLSRRLENPRFTRVESTSPRITFITSVSSLWTNWMMKFTLG
jgi:DNA-directed RNA polymerase subunit RPC12/RpoP